MTLPELLSKIEQLKKEAATLRPFEPKDEQRLWKKFRLEWNYNSNQLEGNTLTYGETQMLLFFDKTTGDHNKREYDEMQAHDVAIKMVQELADDDQRPLTEAFIRNLNQIILVKPFWKEAITPDGQATRREIKIGQYKSFPNSVRLQNGEIFNYATPEETPALMHDLIVWHNENIHLHPVELAALLHYKFVRIHPFDDGNGRVARLLMNYVLMKMDLPPVIIKSKDKNNYINALNKADTGDIPSFIGYVAEQLIWSQELLIKVAKGESIEEQDDIDKQVTLIQRMLQNTDDEIKQVKDEATMNDLLERFTVPIAKIIFEKALKISPLFTNIKITYLIDGTAFSTNNLDSLIKEIRRIWLARKGSNINRINVTIDFQNLKIMGVNSFDIQEQIAFHFLDHKYGITFQNEKTEWLYHNTISESEMDTLSTKLIQGILSQIEEKVKQATNKP